MERLDSHGMLVEQSSHERYRHDYYVDLKSYIVNKLSRMVDDVYEHRVQPELGQGESGRPVDRHVIRAKMEAQPEVRFWNALLRSQHELYVDSTAACVHRQLPELVSKFRDYSSDNPIGTLTLDPGLDVPYYQNVDTHSVPGGYFVELCDDDVYAGARYDIGLNLFTRGARGALNDMSGQHSLAMLRKHYPGFEPKVVADFGCGIGNATLPYVDAWPGVTVYGLDLSAPMLRYAHARAESLGKQVHFRQENAEQTSLESESVDIVTCHILLHETSLQAMCNIFAEAYRVLRPGGMFVSADVPRHITAKTEYEKYRGEWDAVNNNEPYWSTFLFDADIHGCLADAGFDPGLVKEELTSGESGKDTYGYWGLIARKAEAS